MATGETSQTTTTCPHCGRPVDTLRTGAVSIVGGRIVHFCSAACREARLRGAGEPRPEEPAAGDGEGAARAAEAEPVAAPEPATPPPRRRSFAGRDPVWRHFRRPLLGVGMLLAALAAAILAPAGMLAGYVPPGAAALAVLAELALAVAGQRRAGATGILGAAALPLAGAGVLAAGAAGGGPDRAAICVLALLLASRTGRLIEALGRLRSGVLEAALDGEARALARKWRDDSVAAGRFRRVALVAEWIRLPLAAGLAVLFWLLGALPADRALLAGATALVALDPRAMRMITGDAHLGVALAASRRGVVVRDAHAVARAGAARVALFLPHRCLLVPRMAVVDWWVAPGIAEAGALSALAAVEGEGVPGSVGEAVRRFLEGRVAGVAAAEDLAVRPGLGVAGRGERGRILCGSRELMLEELVSTAACEDRAAEVERTGRRAVFLAVAGRVVAFFALEEQPLPRVDEGIRQLAALGVEPAMITSAESAPAQALGSRLGIDDVRFGTPEERLEQALAAFAESGDSVLLVGHGPAFEETFRAAAAAIACGGEGPSLAGIDVRGGGLDEVVRVIAAAREAARSIASNAVAAGAALLVGLLLAAGWHYPESAPVAGGLGAAAAAFTAWNGPSPTLDRVRRRAAELWRRFRRAVGLTRSSAR